MKLRGVRHRGGHPRLRLVGGVVFTAATPQSTVLYEAVQRGSPVLLVGRYIEWIDCDWVTTDNLSGGRLIADWDHTRVGLVRGRRARPSNAELGFFGGS